MVYFIYSLALCLLLSLCLFALLLYRIKINTDHKNRHAISYFLPIVLTVAFIYFSVTITVPRILDVPAVITGRLNIEETTLESDQIGRNSVRTDTGTFYFSFGLKAPESDMAYKIEYTPRSRYIIKVEPIASSSETLQPVD